MDPMIKRTFRDSPNWYVCASTDGAGDKTFAEGITLPCNITGKSVVSIAGVTLRPDYLAATYVVYYDATTYNVRKGDELLIEGTRLPVLGGNSYTPIKKGEHRLGVIYL